MLYLLQAVVTEKKKAKAYFITMQWFFLEYCIYTLSGKIRWISTGAENNAYGQE